MARDDYDEAARDSQWDRRVRGETGPEQLDRNLTGLLQELRVVQTGVQLLTGFLLTLPFQTRFESLSGAMRVVYLVVVVASIAATVLLTAPVAAHGLLFRRHRLESVVVAAHYYALTGLLLLGGRADRGGGVDLRHGRRAGRRGHRRCGIRGVVHRPVGGVSVVAAAASVKSLAAVRVRLNSGLLVLAAW